LRNWILRSRPKIEFVNETPGVAALMPLISAKEVRYPWVDHAVRDFAKIRQDQTWNHKKFMHTARCPGIFSLQRHGWIMRTWQDVVITTKKEDKTNFSWLCARSQDYVGFHPPHQLSDFWEEWPENTLRSVVKINSGWRCIVPKGYYLYEMPLPLYEEHRFTTIPGYFSREAGPASMNVQLLWHVMDGETLIKAGTPIAQYILVPKDQPEMICRDAGGEERKLLLSRLYEDSKFVKNYSEVKKLFGGADD
jgi:hypothetical protein